MPKLPRDLDGVELARILQKLGYMTLRQTGSHMRLICSKDASTHHLTIPAHSPLKIGTLSAILNDLASFLTISKEDLLQRLF